MKVVKDAAKNIRMLEIQRETSLRILGISMKLLRRMIQLFQKKYDKHGIACIIMNIILIIFIHYYLIIFSHEIPKLQALHKIVVLILSIFKKSAKK